MALIVREKTPRDRAWIEAFLHEHWGSALIVSRGTVHNALEAGALIAERDGTRCGLLTYRTEGSEREILSLNAVPARHGAGTQVVEALAHLSSQDGCGRLWLITTNDNLEALRFYQRRGFELVTVHRNAVENSRRLKPTIPAVGNYGIPIRDEIELERIL